MTIEHAVYPNNVTTKPDPVVETSNLDRDVARTVEQIRAVKMIWNLNRLFTTPTSVLTMKNFTQMNPVNTVSPVRTMVQSSDEVSSSNSTAF